MENTLKHHLHLDVVELNVNIPLSSVLAFEVSVDVKIGLNLPESENSLSDELK